MIRDLEVQDTTSFEIIDMLINTWTLYDFTLSYIDITHRKLGTLLVANLSKGLKIEDIRVARLIEEVLTENFQFTESLNPYEVDALFNYLINERGMTELKIREIIAAGNKALEEDQRPLTGRYQGIPDHLKVPSTMQTENAINYLLNEVGMTRAEIIEVIVGNLQESFGNNPNQEAAH